MDLYFLNFKKILVILSSKEMRLNILKILEEHEVDVNVKFADSYFEGANLINENIHNPYNHVVLNLSYNNRKLKDFIEFAKETFTDKPDLIVEYTKDGTLLKVEAT